MTIPSFLRDPLPITALHDYIGLNHGVNRSLTVVKRLKARGRLRVHVRTESPGLRRGVITPLVRAGISFNIDGANVRPGSKTNHPARRTLMPPPDVCNRSGGPPPFKGA